MPMLDHDLVLGLDVGTTNLKCLALDDTGTIIAQESEPTPRSHPRSDWTDFEPGPLWEAACRTIRTVVSQLEHREAVKGIAVSSLAESVVPIDSQGQFLAPAARPPSGGLGYLDCASTILGEPCEQTIFRREPSSDPRSKNLLRFRHPPPVTSRSFRHRLGRFRKSARHSNGMLNNSFTLVLIQMQRH
ncbi:MAG: FGGY family carbohydrate kinase [Chthoniobacterales bacterium]